MIRLAVLPLALACHAAQPESRASVDSCGPASGQLPAATRADGLAGEYDLLLVTAGGPDSGKSVRGRLTLREQSDSLQRPAPVLGIQDTTTRYRYAGTAELDRDALGAMDTGDLASTDPRAPGALLIERHTFRPAAAAGITIRLGAEANRRDLVRYDGGYFALTVRRLDPDGFAGTWASGALHQAAGGYFCAERAPQNTTGPP